MGNELKLRLRETTAWTGASNDPWPIQTATAAPAITAARWPDVDPERAQQIALRAAERLDRELMRVLGYSGTPQFVAYRDQQQMRMQFKLHLPHRNAAMKRDFWRTADEGDSIPSVIWELITDANTYLEEEWMSRD